MIAFYASLGVAALLFVLLFVLGSGRESREGHEQRLKANESHPNWCPPEVVEQVFSRQDLAYISQNGSRWLERLYVSERRRIAGGWIRRNSAELGRAMRNHVRTARERHDIEVATEAKLFLQYAWLRCLCGFLLASSQMVRPSLLQELAVYASKLSQHIGPARDSVRRITPKRMTSGF